MKNQKENGLESEVQQFMDKYQTKGYIVAVVNTHYKRFPTNTFIDLIGGFRFSKEMPVDKLFSLLGLEEDKLKEVYEFKNGGFSGKFVQPDGEQKLADILGKKIMFYYLDEDDHMNGIINPSYLSLNSKEPVK